MVVNLNPVIFHLGVLEVRWYGLMYVIGFLIGGELVKRLIRGGFFDLSLERVDHYVFHNIIGMFLGARIFYVFIYNWSIYSNDWTEIFSVWHGGLSFHGALVGFLFVTSYYARKLKRPFLHVSDTLALAGTQGLFFGRIGNFINGELYGRVSDVPWAMIFPSGGPFPRHPSQLYEAVLEGLVLFSILWLIKPRVKIHGVLSAIFLIGYGVLRFIVEFYREADEQMGRYFGDIFSMGQILCFLMILGGGVVWYWTYRHRAHANYQVKKLRPQKASKVSKGL